jgi:uncharacterized SAM-binding protein YcdF (DUF218 family)
MAAAIVAAAKTIGGPGSIGFFVFCALAAWSMTFVGPRGRKVGRGGLLLLVAGYAALSVPLVANQLADGATSFHPLTDLGRLAGAQTLVVLDGDNRRGRVRETKRVFDAVQPRRVIVSGSSWLHDALQEAGVPEDRIVWETRSRTTRQQLTNLRDIIGSDRTVLIASRLQMPRVAALARTLSLPILLAPSSIDTEPPTSGGWLVVPTPTALWASRDALYERVALAYYGFDPELAR